MIVTPAIGLSAYTCPHCHVLAQQQWSQLMDRAFPVSPATYFDEVREAAPRLQEISSRAKSIIDAENLSITGHALRYLQIGRCMSCAGGTIWLYGQMIFPVNNPAPPASDDMPEVARADYDEAASIIPYSAKAAAALLRLALEKLCAHLLDRNGSINDMIGDFVALGVPPQVRNAMDILRVTGNNAVHAGTMDNVDDQATAIALFGLLNLIVDVMITQPKHLEQMYAGLPEGARKAIEARDQKRLPSTDPNP